MSDFTYWISLIVFAASLWIYVFRVIRRHSDDSESARREAVKATCLLTISFAIQMLGRWLNDLTLVQEAILVVVTIGALTILGVILAINTVPNNYAVTPRQHRWNVITSLMITSMIWVGIPYAVLVFFPSAGLDLGLCLAIGAVLTAILTVWDLITN